MPETERLLLRRWRTEDLEPFAALNADPEVTEYFPSAMNRQQSDALVAKIEAGFDELGYGLWAMEHLSTGAFLGFTGLMLQTFPAPFTPAVEVGWRLARSAWGQGYATEAARASLAVGFGIAGLDEIVSMTATANMRSQRVMLRLGMTRNPADDFLHPNVHDDSPTKPHVLYRISQSGTVSGHG